MLTRDETASAAAGSPAGIESGKREQADWAEFVTATLAGAAANIGGIEAVLNGRPGSWEADGVRSLLTSTVGHDEAYLLEHRTEPVVVDLYVDVILADLGVWTAYDQAAAEVASRYDAINPDAADDEHDRQSDAIAQLEELLERQRVDDWTGYGQALAEAVRAAAEQVSGLSVPVTVRVDLETFPEPNGPTYDATGYGLVHRLREAAITAAPLPGGGRTRWSDCSRECAVPAGSGRLSRRRMTARRRRRRWSDTGWHSPRPSPDQ